MNAPDERPTASGEFGAEYWEGRYRIVGARIPHDPNPSLVAETAALQAGRALDVGCGPGADALWLASRGWHVTAVDVSSTALRRARDRARTSGHEVAARIDWVHADLTGWDPGEARFDLVTSHYVQVPGPPQDLFRRLASWVAPGGTLLVVGHDSAHPEQDDGTRKHGDHPHPPGIRPEQVTTNLPQTEWEIVAAEARIHLAARPEPAGAVTLHDVLVRARRTTTPVP